MATIGTGLAWLVFSQLCQRGLGYAGWIMRQRPATAQLTEGLGLGKRER